ncbi:MAG: leucine-rich repeat domain-containing protein [Parachlamydiales bacterium]|jgi:Leucine-rich repeat (LRR) protein
MTLSINKPSASFKCSSGSENPIQKRSFDTFPEDVVSRIFKICVNRNQEIPTGICKTWEVVRSRQRYKLLAEFFPEAFLDVFMKRKETREKFFEEYPIKALREISNDDFFSKDSRLLECLITDEEKAEILNELKDIPLRKKQTEEEINKINSDWIAKIWFFYLQSLAVIVKNSCYDGCRAICCSKYFLQELKKAYPFVDFGAIIEIKFWVLARKVKYMYSGEDFLTTLDDTDTKISKIKKMQRWLADRNLVCFITGIRMYDENKKCLRFPENLSFFEEPSNDNLHSACENIRLWLMQNQDFLNSIRTLKTGSFYVMTELPPEIGLFTNLIHLDVSSNGLTALPSEMLKLTNLVSLNLAINRLTTLPLEIYKLTNLKCLNVSRNRLKILPREIGLLTKLEMLDFSINQLKTLPTEICLLTKLKALYFANNQLTNLSSEIRELIKLLEPKNLPQ